jgi:hypothetical protein
VNERKSDKALEHYVRVKSHTSRNLFHLRITKMPLSDRMCGVSWISHYVGYCGVLFDAGSTTWSQRGPVLHTLCLTVYSSGYSGVYCEREFRLVRSNTTYSMKRKASCHDGRTSRRALRHRVHMSHLRSLTHKSVDVRRRKVRAVKSDICVSDIVQY